MRSICSRDEIYPTEFLVVGNANQNKKRSLVVREHMSLPRDVPECPGSGSSVDSRPVSVSDSESRVDDTISPGASREAVFAGSESQPAH